MSDASNVDLLKAAESAYEEGDIEVSVKAFASLAERDIAEACQWLGFIYRTGDGCFSNEEKSRFWYGRYLLLLRRCAEGGDPKALLSLGKHYQYGEIVGVDSYKARSLMLRAAELGNADAQFHLATLFLYGWCGCDRDDDAHMEWLDRAAHASHPEALFTKGSYLIHVADTRQEGLELISRSAALGFWVAQEFLRRRE